MRKNNAGTIFLSAIYGHCSKIYMIKMFCLTVALKTYFKKKEHSGSSVLFFLIQKHNFWKASKICIQPESILKRI